MRLDDCTKEELMSIIRKAFSDSISAMFAIKSALSEIEAKRKNKSFQEAENWVRLAADYRNQYTEILKKYGHLKVIDMPKEALQKADNCLKQARMCDRKWEECMKRLGD